MKTSTMIYSILFIKSIKFINQIIIADGKLQNQAMTFSSTIYISFSLLFHQSSYLQLVCIPLPAMSQSSLQKLMYQLLCSLPGESNMILLIQIQMNNQTLQKHLPTLDSKLKYKKQCLKVKNILFENEQLQIGCKILPLYDFYSSRNYLQINLFIGNKTDQILQGFRIQFRGTSNLDLFIEDKNRIIKERTQYKERIVVGCNNYEEDILLLMDFQSSLVTLRSTPIPLTLYNFCIFNKGQSIPTNIKSQTDLQEHLQHRYEYIQQQQISVTSQTFKKSLSQQFQKYFMNMSKICEGVLMGTFTTSTLLDEYVIVLKLIGERKMKICLGGNEYSLFQQIFINFKFLME